MIDVAIQENIQLAKAELNDKGTLVLGLKKTGGEMSLEERMNTADDSATGKQEQDYYIWPFKLDEYVKTGEEILQQAVNMQKTLTHILKGYIKQDKIKWNVLNGINVGEVSIDLIKQSNIDKLYANLVAQFIEQVTPFVGKEILFRVKFVRQSKDKHFSSLPRVTEYSNLVKEPFWESMAVTETIIAYSNYEKGFRKGDKDTPSGVDLTNPAATVQASEPDPKEAADVAEVMGIDVEEEATEQKE